MKFQIYTMYVNRPELLLHAVQSLGHYAKDVVVLDNSLQQDLELPGFKGEIYKPEVPLYCPQSYNLINKMALQRAKTFSS